MKAEMNMNELDTKLAEIQARVNYLIRVRRSSASIPMFVWCLQTIAELREDNKALKVHDAARGKEKV